MVSARTRIALVAVVALIGLGLLWASRQAPHVPDAAASTAIAVVSPEGTIQPDASEGAAAQAMPDSPSGHGCLASDDLPDRWAELCWEAERDGDEHDPQRDDYTFRLHGTFRSSSWAVLRAHLAAPDGARIEDSGSGAEAPGLCQVIAIGGTPDPDQCHLLLGEVLGGDRTRSSVSWLCSRGCAAGATDRSIELRIAVSVPEGGRPSWELFAEAGP